MEFKVKTVEGPDNQSVAEVTEALIANADTETTGDVVAETLDGETPVATEATETPVEATEVEEAKAESSINEEDVLSFLKNKYGREAASLDEFTASPESSGDKDELPEDVAAYLQYKNTTGRGMGDYLKLNRDLSTMDGDTILREYLTDTETGLDSEDIDDLMADYAIDEDVMTDVEVRKARRDKKRVIAEAKKHFTEAAKMYAEPTENVANGISSEDSELLVSYKQSVKDAESTTAANEARSAAFSEATTAVFSPDFKGFDFDMGGDAKLTYSTGSPEELKTAQSTPMNFIGKYMDDDGVIVDAAGYHKALSVAMNPDKFAQFFYEQGQANSKDDMIRSSKNINMGIRTAPEVTSNGGKTVRSLESTSSRGLTIKARKI